MTTKDTPMSAERECNIFDRTGQTCPRHGHSHEHDIIERLRYWEGDGQPHGLLHRAARLEITRLREALAQSPEISTGTRKADD